MAKIKQGVIDYLKKIIGLTNEREIVADLAHLSKSKTPERSINRTLNELYHKGILQKYYIENDQIKTWPTQKADRKLMQGSRLPKLYGFITDSIRKIVSTSIYCGSNELGNADKNPNYDKPRTPQPYRQADESPRKTPSDVKAWTFDTIENAQVDRKRELAVFLLDRLKERNFPATDKCFVSWLNDIIANISVNEWLNYLGYDADQAMTGQADSKLYPVKFWSIRGVEQ
tara:strand:- start:139 stop:825 length:687 start_codon:yes stop_codon:yes gene_type:complete